MDRPDSASSLVAAVYGEGCMPHDDKWACDEVGPASARTPTQHSGDAEASPPKTPPGRAPWPAIAEMPLDPEMERYRTLLGAQLEAHLARRNTAQSVTPSQPTAPRDRTLPLLPWVPHVLQKVPQWLAIAPLVALLVMGGGMWWFHPEPVAPLAVRSASTPPAHEEPEQLKQALLQERDKTEQLSRELTVAWRELSAQSLALPDKVVQERELGDLRQALKQTEELAGAYEVLLSQERQRSHMLDEQLVTRREAVNAASAGKAAQDQEIVTLQQALKQTEERAAGQAQLLSAAMADKAVQEQEFASLRLAVKQAAERAVVQEQALTEERQRSRTLAEQLASETAAREGELSTLRQALRDSEERETSHQRLVAQGRGRIGQLEMELATRQSVVVVADGPAKTAPANGKASDVASDRPTPVAASANVDLARLISRASLLLSQGNIGTARIVLERAAETGSAPALFALAETYDPITLTAWGTFGTQGDVAKARELYAKAFAGGVQEAGDRLNALRK